MSVKRPLLLAAAAVSVLGCALSAGATDVGAHRLAVTAAAKVKAGPGTLVSTTLKVPAGLRTGAFAVTRTLQIPRGGSVAVWAEIPGARFDEETPQHDLLVSVPSAGKIVRLHPGRKPADQPTQSTLVSGLDNPQGMAFDRLGRTTYLYVAETDEIDRYVWKTNRLGARTVIVRNLPGNGPYAHPLKEVTVGPDHTVYFDIASASNINAADRSAGEAEVLSWSPTSRKTSVLMKGVRNGDGLSIDPKGRLWTAVNMRDNVTYPAHQPYGGVSDAYGQLFQSYVNDHPPDELALVTKGRDLGWPYCDPDQGLVNKADRYANVPLRNDPETDSDGHVNCAKLPAVNRGIPAHSAPLGLTFLEGSSLDTRFSGGAALGTHGSNDHVPPRPAELYWLPWNAKTATLDAAQPLLAGFQSPDGDRWGKPVDAVPGPDGALYVTDDTAGAVYRLTLPR